MELFNKRYLCFICFAFMLTSFFLTFYGGAVKLIVGGGATVVLIVALICFIKAKKQKFMALFALLVCLAVSVSAFSSYLFVTRKINEAKSLIGTDTVLVRIVSREYDDKYSVRLLRAGDREVDIKASLYINSEERFEYGDEVIVNAKIYESMYSSDESRLLTLSSLSNSEIYVNKAEIKNYFSYDGFMSISQTLRDKFSAHVDKVFGDYSGLAKGLLVNDKSDIDQGTENDFKRSGTSHILAVSGTHIALLMGAVELLLRKIEVKKKVRMAVVSILSIFFLALTAFEASAVRSVLMLFAVYLCYILYEENDSITALFASVTAIILFSPFSVYDLGMWMSFLATLGILVVYPYFDEKMPYPKQENPFIRYPLRMLIGIAKALMLTVIANFFLLPIMWYFFGAISVSTLPCNLILGPIVTVLMPLCALSTVIGFIPYASIPFVYLTDRLFDLMMLIVRYFSEMRFGVVSLRHAFAGVLITLLTVALIVMLVIKLKHKLLIFAPMLAFVLAFTVCFAIFNYNSRPYVQCVSEGESEIIFVNYGAECSVLDVGVDNSDTASDVLVYMSNYATEIDEYFIVSLGEKDVETLEYVCKNTIIRKIYLSKSLNKEEILYYYEILKCAEKYNISIDLYDAENNVEICNGVLFSYSADEDFLISSNKVKLKKEGERIACVYGSERYDVGYTDGVSNVIPLN